METACYHETRKVRLPVFFAHYSSTQRQEHEVFSSSIFADRSWWLLEGLEAIWLAFIVMGLSIMGLATGQFLFIPGTDGLKARVLNLFVLAIGIFLLIVGIIGL